MRNLTLALLPLCLAACSLPPVNRSRDVPLGAVAQVDLKQYVGKWYELARFPNGFEENCEGVTAEYAVRPDGRIDVLNTCREGSPSGKAREAKGIASVVDPATDARLKVHFGVPFEGDYWILDRADDYAWSLVGEPAGRYLWVLSRTPTVSQAVRDDLLKRLSARGYATDQLKWTQQPPA
jgi:apolipoprotein D and lipocalin family protein